MTITLDKLFFFRYSTTISLVEKYHELWFVSTYVLDLKVQLSAINYPCKSCETGSFSGLV